MKKFENYCSNLNVLSRAGQEDLTNEFIIGGIIDKFHIQFELGWKVLKELLKYEGRQEGNTGSPREILKAAYSIYGFLDEEIWLSMLKDRNSMTHIYDGAEAQRMVHTILDQYIPEFIRLRDNLQEQYPSSLNLL